MPKIIANIRERLLEEAKAQVLQNGYSAMTIRSVAAACGVGVGTVYNYFPSKDMLVASFMLDDWMRCMDVIQSGMADATEPKEALYVMYAGICDFQKIYHELFADENAEASYQAAWMQRHNVLREQLAQPLKLWTKEQTKADPEFLAEFMVEAMLTWTMAGKDYESIAQVLLQMF